MYIRVLISSILLIFFIFPSRIFAQSNVQLIKQVKREVKIISNDSTLKNITLNDKEFLDHTPDGGGQLTGFYKNDQIEKIVLWIGLSYGNEID